MQNVAGGRSQNVVRINEPTTALSQGTTASLLLFAIQIVQENVIVQSGFILHR